MGDNFGKVVKNVGKERKHGETFMLNEVVDSNILDNREENVDKYTIVKMLGNKYEDMKQKAEVTEKEVHYCEPERRDILGMNDVEERLAGSLMNSFENSNKQTDMLIKEEKTKEHTDVLPKEETLRPYVFYFNNYFVSACIVAAVGGNFAQVRSKIKMKEEDPIEEFNP